MEKMIYMYQECGDELIKYFNKVKEILGKRALGGYTSTYDIFNERYISEFSTIVKCSISFTASSASINISINESSDMVLRITTCSTIATHSYYNSYQLLLSYDTFPRKRELIVLPNFVNYEVQGTITDDLYEIEQFNLSLKYDAEISTSILVFWYFLKTYEHSGLDALICNIKNTYKYSTEQKSAIINLVYNTLEKLQSEITKNN